MTVHQAAEVIKHTRDGDPGVSLGEDRVVTQVEGKPGDRLAFDQPVSVAKALYGELKRLDEEGKLGTD